MSISCGRANCLCEHKEPCSAGWIYHRYKVIDERNGRDGTIYTVETWYDGVRPCPTCDPERAHIFATSATKSELQERLKARSSMNHKAQQEDYEASRTRTL